MARDGWFDRRGLDLYRTEFLSRHPAWRQAAADGVITGTELIEQQHKVISKLKRLESRLDDETHEEFTEVLLEYEVLVNMALCHERQEGDLIPGFLTLSPAQAAP